VFDGDEAVARCEYGTPEPPSYGLIDAERL